MLLKKKIVATFSGLLLLASCSIPEKTTMNLKLSVEATCEISELYAVYSAEAANQGFANVAIMFRALSEAESIRSLFFVSNVKRYGVMDIRLKMTKDTEKSTLENLKIMFEHEQTGSLISYPQYVADAINEKADRVQYLFEWGRFTSEKHARFCASAIEALSDSLKGDAYVASEWVVCSGCGDTYILDQAPDKCSLCGTNSRTRFVFSRKC